MILIGMVYYKQDRGDKMNDLIIIGAGPAGLSACLYASRAGLNVLMLDSGAPGGKLNVSAEIENWPGQKKKTGPELEMCIRDRDIQLEVNRYLMQL